MNPVVYLMPPRKGDRPQAVRLSDAQLARLEEVAESAYLRNTGYFAGANDYILTGKGVDQ